LRLLLPACLALAALSLLVVPAAPGYDPWMWLLWGRELAGGALDTSEGPAFKPLPVAVCTLLAPLGPAAPEAWLLLARAGAVAGVALGGLLAYRLASPGLAGGPQRGSGRGPQQGSARGPQQGSGRRLQRGSGRGRPQPARRRREGRAPTAILAGLAAAAGVALTGGLVPLSAAGGVEGTFLAALFAAALLWRDRRIGLALACGLCCVLIRVEAIPFLLLAAAAAWRARPDLRPRLVAGGLAVPALWLLPDALSTGELLRSAARARVPNPGQPALADLPALESLLRAGALALAPVALGVLALRGGRDRAALMLAGAAMAWLSLVAGMAQLGFSGEPRYALPGIAALTVAGAAGLGRLATARRWAPAAIAVVVLATAVPKLAALAPDSERLAYAARLDADLDRAVSLAGGRERLLACGRPTVGDFRGPILAYRLRVPKRRVLFEARATGVAFASRLSGESTEAPELPRRYRVLARAGTWRVAVRCSP